MKGIRNTLLMFSFSGFLVCNVSAEYRPWTDTNGNTIEAEFVRMTGDQVVLMKRGGSEIKISFGSLSIEDQQFAMQHAPPKIKIKVNDDKESDTVGYIGGVRNESRIEVASVTIAVELKKESAEPYSLELRAEVFLIGKTAQLDRFTIIEKSSTSFLFTEENKGVFTFACGPVDTRNVSGARNTGVEYEGYLVVIRDRLGAVIASKANRLEFEKHIGAILESNKRTVFDKDFNVIKKGGGARSDRPARPPS